MTLDIDINIAVQYTFVAVFVLGAIVYMLVRLAKKRKQPGCCGCALSDSCAKPDAEKYRKLRSRKEQKSETGI